MKRAITIAAELDQITTVEDLTGVFEGVASIKIARIRNRVIASKEYFGELWLTYRGLRVDPKEQMSRASHKNRKKSVLVAVTTEGKLGGDIANQVIDEFAKAYHTSPDSDVVVLGVRGAEQLAQLGVPVNKTFHLPESDTQFEVGGVMSELDQYEHISVFYQTYESLRLQKVARIELVSAVKDLSEGVEDEKIEILSSNEYIFEPGVAEIATYLESLMMGVALTQVLMESKLSQYASRFNAMNAAKHRAQDMTKAYALQFHRAKRAEADERLKEIMKVAKGQAI